MRKLGIFILGASLTFAASFSISSVKMAEAAEIEKEVIILYHVCLLTFAFL